RRDRRRGEQRGHERPTKAGRGEEALHAGTLAAGSPVPVKAKAAQWWGWGKSHRIEIAAAREAAAGESPSASARWKRSMNRSVEASATRQRLVRRFAAPAWRNPRTRPKRSSPSEAQARPVAHPDSTTTSVERRSALASPVVSQPSER